MEAVATSQEVTTGSDIAFDIDSDFIDIVGTAIAVDSTGTIFTLLQPGLYHVEWNAAVSSTDPPAVVGLLENGLPSTASTLTSEQENCSSGALIYVEEDDIPYTIRLHNFRSDIILVEHPNYLNTAASIRILRFADGAV